LLLDTRAGGRRDWLMVFPPFKFTRDLLLLAIFGSLAVGCASSNPYENEQEAGPEVGPVAAVLDGDEDADPLAAEIDVSNEAAEEADYDPY